MRLPFLERVPNALFFVRFLSEHGYAVRIVSTSDPKYPLPEPMNENVAYEVIRSREQGVRGPTSFHLLRKALQLAKRCAPQLIIGIDACGNIVASVVRRLTGIPHVNFVLEYPQPRAERRSLIERLEVRALRCADLVITHDAYHRDFLQRETGVQACRIHLLPNGSGPRPSSLRSDYLTRALGLPPSDTVVLHSGGFGPWFCCHELAVAAAQWDSGRKLVFHTSHYVEDTPYAREFRSRGLDKHAILHSSPVPDAALDQLVSSAKIGLAIYSLPMLGFRAEYLGLAAGKIGRYLKNGIPVIATNTVSLREYVEGYRCGLCVDRLEQIGDAISTILADYDTYRKNAFRCYDELWDIGDCCAELMDRLECLELIPKPQGNAGS